MEMKKKWIIVTAGGNYSCDRISYPKMREDVWDMLGESVEKYEEITCLEHAWRLVRAGNMLMFGSADTHLMAAIFPEHICAISYAMDDCEEEEEEE